MPFAGDDMGSAASEVLKNITALLFQILFFKKMLPRPAQWFEDESLDNLTGLFLSSISRHL